jgi:type I restriction enzyme R subunit
MPGKDKRFTHQLLRRLVRPTTRAQALLDQVLRVHRSRSPPLVVREVRLQDHERKSSGALNGFDRELRPERSVWSVQARSFAELLEQSVRRYQNRAIETAQVIEELIQLAKDKRAANARGEELHLSEDELAFYEALEVNDSAVKFLGEPTLVKIARELVETVKRNVTIDWTLRENVRAHLRVIVKRILRNYGYPPDKQEKATQLVLEQAEVLSEGWA